MWTSLIIIFLVCYLLIALEHVIKINKSAIALFMAVVLWTIVLFFSTQVADLFNKTAFDIFLSQHLSLASQIHKTQTISFLVNSLLIRHLGDISETLFFLLGAMTVVELIDVNGGFNFITNRISSKHINTLLWVIAFITFFLSALLDNMTTTIVMIMLIRKLLPLKKIRWWFAGMIVIAANAGGAWSPIGDVTTIMLWVKGNITTLPTVTHLILPSLTAMVIPVAIISYRLRGVVKINHTASVDGRFYEQLSSSQRRNILIMGIVGLMCVPVFKSVTHLPPFMGILAVLSLLWIYTELAYKRVKDVEEHKKNRVSRVLSHIDMSTILFFLGILLAVAALQVAGILGYAANFLDKTIHNGYIINGIIGVMSSIVDNVPLVAATTGMYPIQDPNAVQAASYAADFIQDGSFWQLLAYSAGTGGSILLIGSAAGVVVMGLEKMSFAWYMKRFSLLAFIGYIAGIVVYWLQSLVF